MSPRTSARTARTIHEAAATPRERLGWLAGQERPRNQTFSKQVTCETFLLSREGETRVAGGGKVGRKRGEREEEEGEGEEAVAGGWENSQRRRANVRAREDPQSKLLSLEVCTRLLTRLIENLPPEMWRSRYTIIPHNVMQHSYALVHLEAVPRHTAIQPATRPLQEMPLSVCACLSAPAAALAQGQGQRSPEATWAAALDTSGEAQPSLEQTALVAEAL